MGYISSSTFDAWLTDLLPYQTLLPLTQFLRTFFSFGVAVDNHYLAQHQPRMYYNILQIRALEMEDG
jgi:hypothetical protein